MRRELQLPSGLRVTIKSAGPAAKLAFQKHVTEREAQRLRDQLPAGAEAAEVVQNPSIDADLYRRVQLATVEYVCACCVEPRLWPEFPPPAGATYYDDLDADDWQALQAAVTELQNEKKSASKGLRATGTET